MLHVFVDADACPVKEEIYRVTRRYGLQVTLVANSRMRVPDDAGFTLEVVAEGLDAADDWIADHVHADDIVITADIPLASRCLQKGARVIGTTGRSFTEDNISDAMATRELMSELRASGSVTGGPAPFQRRDSSRFMQTLDAVVQSILRDLGQDA